MPGLASQEQLNALADARGLEAERRFLTLMIRHHEAGVDMAKYAVENAGHPAVVRLAETIVTSQSAELAMLRDMLDARGGPLE